jgi:hypothetical protein
MAMASAIAEAGDIRGGEEGLKAESGKDIVASIEDVGGCIGIRASGDVWREVFV